MMIPPLFLYFLPFCYPYILLHFQCFLLLYNFAHFLVAMVKSLTAIALVPVWYRAARAQLLVPVLNVPEWKLENKSKKSTGLTKSTIF